MCMLCTSFPPILCRFPRFCVFSIPSHPEKQENRANRMMCPGTPKKLPTSPRGPFILWSRLSPSSLSHSPVHHIRKPSRLRPPPNNILFSSTRAKKRFGRGTGVPSHNLLQLEAACTLLQLSRLVRHHLGLVHFKPQKSSGTQELTQTAGVRGVGTPRNLTTAPLKPLLPL